MISGIFLWGEAREGLTGPLDPESLAGAHPTWATDAESFGPWTAGEEPGLLPDHSPRVWRAARSSETPVVVVDHCPTTMEAARLLHATGALPPWGAVLAVRQTRGRGQLRRPWQSPAGNLHASVILPQLPPDWSELLPLVAGWCFCRALDDLGISARIKWPNDLLVFDRKVGGMLIEEQGGVLVLGLGLNLNAAPGADDLREGFAVPTGTLSGEGRVLSPLTIWTALVNAARKGYTELSDVVDPSRFLPLVTDRLAWMGRRVRVLDGGEAAYEARIAGLDRRGGLLLDRGGRMEVLTSGSVAPL